MADPMAAYEAEVKRMHATYGPQAEVPHPPRTPTGLLSGVTTVGGVPLSRQPVAARIEDLANQIASAGHQVTEARQAYEQAARARAQAETRFAELATALLAAIHEHREGTPENVPYQP